MTAAKQRPTRSLRRRAVYYSMREVADAVGWSVPRVRRRLVEAGAIEQLGRHLYTTRGLLRLAFPRAWHEVLAELRCQDE